MSPALQRPHVLIVSDDSELTTFLGEGLVYAGFWTSIIANGVQALEVFRLRSFDVMLLDAALSGIGALDLATAEAAGADGVIFAPVELEQLAVELGRAVTAWRLSHPDRNWADEA